MPSTAPSLHAKSCSSSQHQIVLKAHKQDQSLQAMRNLARLQCCVGMKDGCQHEANFLPRLFYYLDCLLQCTQAASVVRLSLRYSALQFNNLLCKRLPQIYEMNCTAS